MISPTSCIPNSEVLGGTPVFTGTRVPVQSLFRPLGRRAIHRRLPGGVSERPARASHCFAPKVAPGPVKNAPDVRILLDENLDWRLRRELSGHIVDSVPLVGRTGLPSRHATHVSELATACRCDRRRCLQPAAGNRIRTLQAPSFRSEKISNAVWISLSGKV